MLKNYTIFLFSLLSFCSITIGQEIQQFQLADFDLKGLVKTSTVITDYGKEIFEFNEEGFLVKSTTWYNEEDKDITTYKYEANELLEKRMESYRGNQLDEASSMVNFYEIDTTGPKRIKEKIISFDKEFFEQREYFFNSQGQLEKIVSSHENAVDEVVIEHSTYKNETTKTYLKNGAVKKSIRTSVKKNSKGLPYKVELTKEFVNGEPIKALEKVIDEKGVLMSEQLFTYDTAGKEFTPSEKRIYKYTEEGILQEMLVKQETTESKKGFVFQFDDSEFKNWVKKITTPDNDYVTRKIEYFVVESEIEETPE